ncbi:MAG TPA: methyltransferase [Anaerolineaceae bacterium]
MDINRQFYQNFAASFSVTRRRLQTGVTRILAGLPEGGHLVDLGCGNGELAATLARRGWRGAYLGVDFSPGLLADAEGAIARLPDRKLETSFLPLDLGAPGALPALAEAFQPVSAVFAFAVLHHLPGEEARRGLLGAVRRVLRASAHPAPVFIHSEWQFLSSPRLAARILPWERAELNPSDLDPGDYLLDWRRDGNGLRYVHAFSEAELAALAESVGFHIRETFYSDGDNGRLGLYQVWECAG